MSVCDADPWQVKNNDSIEQQQQNGNIQVIEKFEDNFNPNNKAETQTRTSPAQVSESNATGPQRLQPLPDSANYLQLLERKLKKVQKGSKLLDSLQEKKQDCMRNLLGSNGAAPATTLEQLLELDTPIESGRLHRHLLPVQAVTVGETLHIVAHDALEQQQQAAAVEE
ncbi:hypothetical protein KR222_001862, partial [Zaprionus bogoriensis]